MHRMRLIRTILLYSCVVMVVMLSVGICEAAVPGISGPTFNLTAKDGYISTTEGNSIYMWGYANGESGMQYPGPTLIVTEGDTVTVNLTNELTVPVSMVFPGQASVTASGGTAGLLTQEASPSGGTVSYSFVANEPGTYMYHSGTQSELQIDMGLVGALIVRPPAVLSNDAEEETPDADPVMVMRAYNHDDSVYDYEYLFLMTEIDHRIHQLAEYGLFDQIDNTTYFPTYFFFNGRTSPDVMAPNNVPWLPSQPYNCMPMTHPGERVLLRLINAGRTLHPFHTHGNHMLTIARDGRLLESVPETTGADLAELEFTTTLPPGGTADAIWTWTGEKLGWDIYGHSAEDPMEPNEYEPDHGKPFPVILPDKKELMFGTTYSGSPFLGALGALPPGEGGFNLGGGYFHMWHSHKEKELLNFDTFPGGMMTLVIIVPYSVPITH